MGPASIETLVTSERSASLIAPDMATKRVIPAAPIPSALQSAITIGPSGVCGA